MNAVGIDVSKGKSTFAIVQPFGVVVAEPFEVSHNAQEMKELVELLKLLSGETKVIMEYTGIYYEPIVNALHNADIFVSVVNPLAINDYDKNRVRQVSSLPLTNSVVKIVTESAKLLNSTLETISALITEMDNL